MAQTKAGGLITPYEVLTGDVEFFTIHHYRHNLSVTVLQIIH